MLNKSSERFSNSDLTLMKYKGTIVSQKYESKFYTLTLQTRKLFEL